MIWIDGLAAVCYKTLDEESPKRHSNQGRVTANRLCKESSLEKRTGLWTSWRRLLITLCCDLVLVKRKHTRKGE